MRADRKEDLGPLETNCLFLDRTAERLDLLFSREGHQRPYSFLQSLYTPAGVARMRPLQGSFGRPKGRCLQIKWGAVQRYSMVLLNPYLWLRKDLVP